jgi:hypothetical protein
MFGDDKGWQHLMATIRPGRSAPQPVHVWACVLLSRAVISMLTFTTPTTNQPIYQLGKQHCTALHSTVKRQCRQADI